MPKKNSNKTLTGKRAATSRSAPPAPLPKAARRFLDVAGAFIEHWGFKRVQGEIWALVFLSGRPMTASEIAQQLGVSKALVSLAMGELLEYRVLLLTEGDDARAQRLVPNENLGEAIASVLRLRERKLLDEARVAVEAIGKLSSKGVGPVSLAPGRLQNLAALIDDAQNTLSFLLNGLENQEPPRPGAPRSFT